jgi:hypothetical protein
MQFQTAINRLGSDLVWGKICPYLSFSIDKEGIISTNKGRRYKLRSELFDVMWFDYYNKDIIIYIIYHQGFTLSIEEALKMGLDNVSLWGENLWTHMYELDRTFLRLGLGDI